LFFYFIPKVLIDVKLGILRKVILKNQSCKIAPMEVEILVSRFSAYKIAMDSGTDVDEKIKSFCSKKQ